MKTSKMITGVAALTALTVWTGCASRGGEKEEAISMDKVPTVVKTTLANYATDSEVKGAEKGDQDGRQVYEFDIQKGTRKYEVAISTEGKFMGTEEDVDFNSLPEAVQKTLNDQAKGGKVSGCEKTVDASNKVTYEADIVQDGKKSEIAVDADGKVLKTDSASKEKGEKEEKD